MSRAYVLMTAMPPTKGHLHLIEFAEAIADYVLVIVCTQPSEPFAHERWLAVNEACRKENSHIKVMNLHSTLEQNPQAPGFWPMWDNIMRAYGFQVGDYVVSSEPYGATLASRLGGTFMPYDPNRQLYYTKGTRVREDPAKYFQDILPEFQRELRQTVTIFGAESTGKTTLSHELSIKMNGHWLFEYARPYLETVGTDITKESMTGIWKGQAALQRHTAEWMDKPWVIQDTDLWSTVGYWDLPHWSKELGSAPDELCVDAKRLKSDLYIVTPSNIPFEADPLRYGGDKREGSDEYWISVLDYAGVKYEVLKSNHPVDRLYEAASIMEQHWDKVAESIAYDRQGL
jgi:HTH-type transcriptional repressor of NAD biosynthesis genes